MKFLRWLFGYRYVANMRSYEIHILNSTHPNCHLDLIANKRYLTKRGMRKYINQGFDGCRWCMKHLHTD